MIDGGFVSILYMHVGFAWFALHGKKNIYIHINGMINFIFHLIIIFNLKLQSTIVAILIKTVDIWRFVL